MTDVPGEVPNPRDRLTSRLGEWHLAAGAPSTRSIAAELGTVSHTTIAETLAGRRLPSWPVLASIVRNLGGDPAEARTLWAAARTDGVPEPEVAALGAAVRALGGLDRLGRQRVLAYLEDRFGGPAPEATREDTP